MTKSTTRDKKGHFVIQYIRKINKQKTQKTQKPGALELDQIFNPSSASNYLSDFR